MQVLHRDGAIRTRLQILCHKLPITPVIISIEFIDIVKEL